MPEATTTTSFGGTGTTYSSLADGATVTIPGVELLKVGTWAASTGPVTVTPEHLADAVAAALDPEVAKAPLKLGHTGALSTLGDSAPGLGWASNLHLSDDGQTLIGDLTDIPAALEAPIKAGFKSRSAEIAWAVKTAAGKTYSAVIDGLALLGVQAPAIKSLADLPKLYEQPAVALASAALEAGSRSTLSLYDTPAEPTLAERIADAVQWAKQSASNIAAVTGSLAGLQAAWDALDAMVPTDSRGLLAADPHAVPVPTPAPGGTMPETTLKPEELAKARGLLGMAEDATDEQVTARLSELNSLVTAGKPVVEPEPKVDEPKVPVAAFSADTIAELKAAGLSVVPTDVLNQVQAGAAAGAEARTLLAAQSRDAILDQAQAAGKFGAGDTAVKVRSAFSAQLDENLDGAKAIIDALPALVPVGEIGHAGPGPDPARLSEADDATWAAWEADVFRNANITTPED